jgi:hypothetical protein
MAAKIAVTTDHERREWKLAKMTKNDFRKGVRVVFRGPVEPVTPVFDASNHKLIGVTGTVVLGVSEDIWCYPDDPSSDMVWVAFDGDRLSKRQVSAAWLEQADGFLCDS